MEVKLKAFILETLVKLSGFSWFGLKDKIFFNKCLDLFLRWNFGDILSDVDERAVALQLIFDQFGEDELDFRIKFPDFQTFQIFLFELPDNISIVGDHSFQEIIKGDFIFEAILWQIILELIFNKFDIMIDKIISDIIWGYFLLSLRYSL